MQPYFFPYVGYFQLISAVDKFVLYDDVNYIKKGWINRNQILVNERPHLFTIPIENASQNVLIKDMKLAVTAKWKKNFLKTIEHAYKKAPYFEEVLSMVDDVLSLETRYLLDWLRKAIELVTHYLGVETALIEASTNYNNRELKAQDRILDICITEKTDEYLNLIGGKKIYNKHDFKNRGIELLFIKTKDMDYQHFHGRVRNNLSIIDVLMFNSIAETNSMLNAFDLI